MDAATAWLLARPRPARRRLLAAAAAAAASPVAAAWRWALLAPLLGGLAGAALFAVGLLAWRTLLAPATRDRVNLFDGASLTTRRRYLAATTAGWLVVVMLSSRMLPAPARVAMGTLNVTVLLALGWLFRGRPGGPSTR